MPVTSFNRLDKARIHRFGILRAARKDLGKGPGQDREQHALECGIATRGKAAYGDHHRAEPARQA
jgi:hypothetical protein